MEGGSLGSDRSVAEGLVSCGQECPRSSYASLNIVTSRSPKDGGGQRHLEQVSISPDHPRHRDRHSDVRRGRLDPDRYAAEHREDV